MELVTIAILAKDKAHTLPLYLKCINNLNYLKKNIILYFRTNDNTDNTEEIIKDWIIENGDLYHSIYFDNTSIDEKLKEESNKHHNWNSHRFKILGEIRNESLKFAYQNNSHYFVIDCDNFILPNTLKCLIKSEKPIVGPFLRTVNNFYSNYHDQVNSAGYMKINPNYYSLYKREVIGDHKVDVIHCTYFIRNQYIPYLSYLDDTERHEYVIFSHNARKMNIPQYLNNQELHGLITFAETKEQMEVEKMEELVTLLSNLQLNKTKIMIISPQSQFDNRMRALASCLH